MRRGRFIFVMGLAAAVAACACSHRSAPAPAAAAPPPAPASPVPTPSSAAARPAGGGTFDRPKLGIRLDWPVGWVARNDSGDYVLVVGRPGVGEEGPPWPAISLDVPSLPPHLPGMIPIGSVRSG